MNDGNGGEGESPLEQDPSGSGGVFRRIWKYRFHYVIVLPALLLLFIFKVIPLLEDVYGSFVEMDFMGGLSGSHWAGMDNYRRLFALPEFRTAIANTLLLKLYYSAFCGMVALVLALAVSAIGNAKLRGMFTTLFLIPYFIPSLIFAYMALFAISPDYSPFGLHATAWMNAGSFRIAYIATEIVKTVGIPTLIAVAAIGSRHAAMAGGLSQPRSSFLHRNLVPALTAVSAFMIMQFSTILSGDFELIRALSNPLVSAVGDTLDNFRFRSSFMLMDVKLAEPAYALQFIVQFGCSLLAYSLVRKLFAKRLFSPSGGTTATIEASGGGKSKAGLLISATCGLLVIAVVYLLFVYPVTVHSAGPGMDALLNGKMYATYLLLYVASTAVFLLITLTLSFPLTVKDLPGRGLLKGFLVAVLAAGGQSFFDYRLMQEFGLTNTVFAVYIHGFFALVPIFILKSIYSSKHESLRSRFEGRGETYMFFQVYIPRIWKPLVALGAMHFVMLWGDSFTPMLYLSQQNLFPPMMNFYSAQSEVGEGGQFAPATLLRFGALIALPSMLLPLFLRKWLTAEVLTGQARDV